MLHPYRKKCAKNLKKDPLSAIHVKKHPFFHENVDNAEQCQWVIGPF